MLLEKLHPVFSLAPKPYVICRDASVLGAVFYVMEHRRVSSSMMPSPQG
jgi:aminoglycoside phosphotransferase (APT) family kinase protein